MKAQINSTTEVVEINDVKGNRCLARVWEGMTEAGVPFTAYVTNLQIDRKADNSQFAREMQEHSQPSLETRRAIDLRFII